MEFTSLLLLTAFLVLLSYSLYQWITKNHNFFNDNRIPCLAPKPIFGNTAAIFFKQIELIDFLTGLYNLFPNKR